MSIATICAKIDQHIIIDCANPLQAGTNDSIFIFNFEDWSNATISRNSANPQIIEDIVMPTGVTGFQVQGINNSNMPKNSMVKGKFINSFMHEINFKAFTLNASIKKTLENMSKGRFVVIVQNNYKGAAGDAAYEVYGGDSGLVCTAIDRDPQNNDTQGAYDITLQSSDQSKEAHLPATVFITDYATTKALVESLV